MFGLALGPAWKGSSSGVLPQGMEAGAALGLECQMEDVP